MNIDLGNKYAMVCGSTQGIGKAIAVELASLGASVILVARNEEKLKGVCKELPVRSNAKHSYICADFTNPENLKQKLQEYVQKQGVIHILVNNTGGPAPGTAFDAKTEEFQQAFSAHLVCNQILVQTLVPCMKKAQYGRIINIISISVKEPIKGLGVSNTIRAAVASWAKTLATELGPNGITVNNILPGYTNTERLKSLIVRKATQGNKSQEDVVLQMCADIPLGRFADPSETANAVAFLASPAASYITGINLPVDGGRLSCL